MFCGCHAIDRRITKRSPTRGSSPADVTVPKSGVVCGFLVQILRRGRRILKVTLFPDHSMCCLNSPKPVRNADKSHEPPGPPGNRERPWTSCPPGEIKTPN